MFSAGFTPAWEPHVLVMLPMYTALLPLFLRQTAARASQYGNPVLEDLKQVSCPDACSGLLIPDHWQKGHKLPGSARRMASDAGLPDLAQWTSAFCLLTARL